MNEPILLTVEEVAGLLRVKPSWIYARTRDGALAGTGRGRKPLNKKRELGRTRTQPAERIPHFKAGKLLRFDRAEVLAWWSRFHRNGAETLGEQPEGEPQAIENASQEAGC